MDISPQKLTIRQAVLTVRGLTPIEVMEMEVVLAEAVKSREVRGNLVHDHPDKWRLRGLIPSCEGAAAMADEAALYGRVMVEGTVNHDLSTVVTESFKEWASRITKPITGLQLAERIKSEGESKELEQKEIVKNIDDAGCNLKDAEIGYLFGEYNKGQYETARKRGRRLRGKTR
jgi:hypothetical protein